LEDFLAFGAEDIIDLIINIIINLIKNILKYFKEIIYYIIGINKF